MNPFLQDTDTKSTKNPFLESDTEATTQTTDTVDKETNPFLEEEDVTTKKITEEREKLKRVTLPDFLGGGEFFSVEGKPMELETTPRDVPQDLKDEIRGGGFYETDEEVDHIIPKSLGGTDQPENLQALESEQSLWGQVKSFVGMDEETPGERPKEERQEGKMIKEWEALDKYKKGELTLPQARLEVMKHQQKPKDVSDFFWESFKEAPGDIVKGVSDIFKEDKESEPFKTIGKEWIQLFEGGDKQKTQQKPQTKQKDFEITDKEALKFQDIEEEDIDKKAAEKATEVIGETKITTPERKEGESNIATQFVKTAAQETIRDFLIYSNELFPQLEKQESGDFELTYQEGYKPGSELESFITGIPTEDQPIPGFGEGEKAKDLKTIGKEWTSLVGIDNPPEWLALTVGSAQMLGDLGTGGVSDNIVKKASQNIASLADEGKILDELFEVFPSAKRENLKPMAKTLKETDNSKNVEKFLKDTIKFQKKSNVQEAKQAVKTQDELLQEAKNYDNVDDFVKANKNRAPKKQLENLFEQSKKVDEVKALSGQRAIEGEDFFMTPTNKRRWSARRREESFIRSTRSNLFKKQELEKSKILNQRRNKVNAIADYFKIPEKEISKIFKKDLNRMTKGEFNSKFNELKSKADELAKEVNIEKGKFNKIKDIKVTQANKKITEGTLTKLKKRHNIGRMQNATSEQIDALKKDLEQLNPEDTVLTEKQIEGLKPFIGDDVYKPVSELSKKYNIDVVKTNTLSRVSPITRKAERDPLLGQIINHTTNNMQVGRISKKAILRDFDDLYKKAIKSQKGIKGKKKKVWDNIFRHLSGEDVKLTQQEQELADFMQDYFKHAKDYLLERGDMNLPRKDYIPHISKKLSEYISDYGFFDGAKRFIDHKRNLPEDQLPTNIWQNLEYIIGDRKYFQYVQRRKNAIEPSRDLERIFKGYAGMFETKKALDDSLPSLQAAAQVLSQPKTAKWLTDYANQIKGRGFDFKIKEAMSEASWVADRLVDLQYLAFLGFRPMSAAMNSIGGNVMTFSFQPIHKYLLGKKRLAANPKRSYDIISRHGFLDGDYVEYASGGFPNLINEGGFAFQKMAEYEVRGSAVVGQLTKQEFKTGKISGDRVREIMDFLEDTQGVFTAERAPLAAKTVLGRSMLQFSRWMITDTSKVKETVKGGLKDLKKGKVASKNIRNMTKLIMAHMAGGYLATEFSKDGNEQAEKMAQALQEPINVTVRLLTAELPAQMVTDNPALQQIRHFKNDMEMINYKMGVRRYPFKFQQKEGVADSYVGLVHTLKDHGILEPESASQWHSYLKTLPSEEANKRFKKLQENKSKVASRVEKYALWDKLELSTKEREFARMGVENKERAKAIDDYIMDLPKEERNAKFKQLKKAGIITDTVEEQIKEMR